MAPPHVHDVGDRPDRCADGLWDHSQPAWSPDGREIAYADSRNVWIVPASGGRARRVASPRAGPGARLHPRRRFPLLFLLSRGHPGPVATPEHGGEAVRVTLGTGPEVEPSLAGPRLAFSTYVSNLDVVLVDLQTGQRHRLSGLRMEATPAFSPDGRLIFFCSDRGGTVDLWSQRLERGRPVGAARRLTDDVGTRTCRAFARRPVARLRPRPGRPEGHLGHARCRGARASRHRGPRGGQAARLVARRSATGVRVGARRDWTRLDRGGCERRGLRESAPADLGSGPRLLSQLVPRRQQAGVPATDHLGYGAWITPTDGGRRSSC